MYKLLYLSMLLKGATRGVRGLKPFS